MNIMSGKSVDFSRTLLFLRGGMPFLVAGETFSETEYHSAAVTSGAVERFAGAHPSQQSCAPSYKAADGHAFRSAPDDPGSLLHGYLMQKKGGGLMTWLRPVMRNPHVNFGQPGG